MLPVYQYLCNKCFGLLHQIIRVQLIAYHKIAIISCNQRDYLSRFFTISLRFICPSLCYFNQSNTNLGVQYGILNAKVNNKPIRIPVQSINKQLHK